MRSEPKKNVPPRSPSESWSGELLLYVSLLALFAFAGPLYQPFTPSDAAIARLHAIYAAAALLPFVVTGPARRAWTRSWLLRAALTLGVLVLVAPGLNIPILLGGFALLVGFHLGALALGILALAGLVTLAVLARRRRARWRTVRIFAAGIVALPMASYLTLAALWWRPATPAECAPLTHAGEIERLSPASWLAQGSQPYELWFVPAEHLLVATFKMAGNGTFSWWDDPRANRLLLARIETAAAPQIAVVPFDEPLLVQFARYNLQRRQLAVGRVGAGDNRIDTIDLTRFPTLSVVGEARPPEMLGSFAVSPDGDTLYAPDLWGRFDRYDWQTLTREGRPFMLGRPLTLLLNAYQRPGARYAYYSSIADGPIALDTQTGRGRPSDAPLVFGNVVEMPSRHRLFATDLLRERLVELSTDTMRVLRAVPLGFSSRALATDDRDRLFVGGWLSGEVHVLDATTLKPVGRPFFVGRYLRDMAYDTNDDRLFTGSACGVFQVRPAAWR